MEYTKTIRNSKQVIIELNMLKASIYYFTFKNNESTYFKKVIKYKIRQIKFAPFVFFRAFNRW